MGKQRKGVKSLSAGCIKPDFKTLTKESPTFAHDFQTALHYIQYDIKYTSLKINAVNYAKKNGLDHKSLDLVVGHKFSTVGKACYVVMHGGELPPIWENHMLETIPALIEEGKTLRSEVTKENCKVALKPVINIQDVIKEQAGIMSGAFDGWIDDFVNNPKKFDLKKCDPVVVLKGKGAKAAHARYIISFYKKDIEELKEVLAKSDPQLIEAYSNFSTPQLKRFMALYETIISAANMIIETDNVKRKPKKRKIDVDKVVSKLKFRKDDSSLRLVSINPIEIIGAKELWVYNIRSRKIGRYIAEDESGLFVRGTTVRNFASASTEKTLRKPKEQLATFKKSGKVALRKYMDKLTTVDIKLKGRLSDNHVLLKVG